MTYKLYQEGRTIGTFQFESVGMQQHLRELKPTVFEDLIAMNALYRPGPMAYIPDFIKRKHNPSLISYDLPCMEQYLKDTYGITVYQEQVMLLSRQLADFTRGESDSLRKAMGKKKKNIVDAMKPKFIEGGIKNGHPKNVLEKIWKDWEKFAEYAFNKSHATCYSWVAYQTAYMKAHFPSEFMAAIMSRRRSDIKEITKLMDECKSMNIPTLGPDVNESYLKFGANKKGEIRFGLAAIKGMGESAAEAIISEREKNGPFSDIFDFVQRINLSNVNRKAFESLALSGGFDSFGIPRETYFTLTAKGDTFLDQIMRYGQLYQLEKQQAQNSLFGDMDSVIVKTPTIPKCDEWSTMERLNKERELIGIYLSAHPLDEYSLVLKYVCNTKCSEIKENLEELSKRGEVVFGGIVTNVRTGVSKRGSNFGIVTIEDYDGSGEVALFKNDWAQWQNFLTRGSFVLIRGKAGLRFPNSTQLGLTVQSVQFMQDVKAEAFHQFTIIVNQSDVDEQSVDELYGILSSNAGDIPIYFVFHDSSTGDNLTVKSRSMKVSINKDLINFFDNSKMYQYSIS